MAFAELEQLGSGAVGLATFCDFTLVADSATLAFPEMRKGLPPAAIMADLGRYALPKRVFPLVPLHYRRGSARLSSGTIASLAVSTARSPLDQAPAWRVKYAAA